ncbi:uncharacterized protein [Rutidosis leptorrhynchoides]|uniref:uncharacterized protein n=1 Tax=Rutidosis leptorrhynchoides TaxID=125765 RepID=UPI003A9A31C4
MPAIRHCSRLDTSELKLRMETRLGSHKAEKYFNLLIQYLSLKLKKSEFDKLCIHLIGRENIRLHNELIRAIVKNATNFKIPPKMRVQRDSQSSFKDFNGVEPINSIQLLCRDAFPQSSKRGRTPNLRERKFKDRMSPLGLNEKADLVVKRGNAAKNGKEVELDSLSPAIYRRKQINTPFGISLHLNDTPKVLHSVSGAVVDTETCYYSGQFLDTNSLGSRLKQKLKMEGLDISMDCVNLLNKGLDVYLKRVLKRTLELAGSRSLHNQRKRFTPSMLDFRVATETNFKILGPHGELFEKITLFGID